MHACVEVTSVFWTWGVSETKSRTLEACHPKRINQTTDKGRF